jgi:hypothetical protein
LLETMTYEHRRSENDSRVVYAQRRQMRVPA